MNKLPLALLACLLVAPHGVLAQQDMDASDAGVFRVGQYGVEHDPIQVWAYYYSPSRGALVAAVNASAMSDGLSRAGLQIRCHETFAGPEVTFVVQYVATGEEYPDDEYMFDLFNSRSSGRPAAYNLGDGFVRTDDISFSELRGDRPPNEYLEASHALWSDLQSMDGEATIEVRFEARALPGPYAWMRFPLTGLHEVRQSSTGYCQ